MSETILVTGAAGFIGYHVCRALLERGSNVVGIDNLEADNATLIMLQQAREEELHKFAQKKKAKFTFYREDLCSFMPLLSFEYHQPDKVVHLAGRSGVRPSIDSPELYIRDNVYAFGKLIERCMAAKVQHIVYASSSSVYGSTDKTSNEFDVVAPESPYAATKRSCELLAESVSLNSDMTFTGLRYFTVYGPYGRPDMAMFKFTRAIYEGETLELFNNGDHARDFTYVDDVVQATLLALDNTKAKHDVFNVAAGQSRSLSDVVSIIQNATGIVAADVRLVEKQKGDVHVTSASIEKAKNELGYRPKFRLETGIGIFVDWYREFYGM